MATPAAPAHEKPHHPHWPVAAFLFLFVFILGLGSIHESSTWIRVKTGARIAATGALPRADPFSYGASGAAWTTDSWLTDVLFAKAEALGGPGLVSVIKSAAIAGGFALLLPINPGSPLLAAALLSLGACAAWGGMAETPAAFDFLLLALFLRLLRPRRRFSWTDGAAAAGLTALWANLHGASAPLAVCLTGLKTFKASLRTTPRERAAYWATLAACVLLFSWNPHGYGLLFHVFSDASAEAVAWPVPLVSLAGLFLLAGLASCWWTLQQEFVTTLAAASVMALSLAWPGLRPLAVLASCPVIALALGHLPRPRADGWPRALRGLVFAVVLLALYREAVTKPLAPTGGYGRPALAGAVHFLAENGVRGRLFNAPETGAELIGLSDRPVFSDARLSLYPESFRADAQEWPRRFRALDAVYRFDYAVVLNRRAAAPGRVFDESPDWRLAYADDRALVYLKRSGVNAWLVGQAPFRLLTPNRLWPDGLDAALTRPREAARVLEELDRWSVAAPDCAQALFWKAYALGRLKMPDRADRLLEQARTRAGSALDWDPELQALDGYVLESRGRGDEARGLLRRAERGARRLGEEALAAEVGARLRRLETPVGVTR